MAESVQCPVCEFTIELPDPEQSSVQLLSLLVDKDLLVDAGDVEDRLHDHLTGHGILEWVSTLKKADAYIAELEKANTRLVDANDSLTLALAETQDELDLLQNLNEAYDGTDRLTARPPRRPTQPHVPPDTTLIPLLSTAERPEGVVGRKS